ncbi:MAG: 5'-methylthioadenosine/adenosylhomocysteine nucleosidase [Clostridia bacterium]|nr:5'-methylthioadenosine/adenosylhomocysteine nucleosidase [Clostridia bacterium]MBP3649242.1 5'-methylthioadenosine/adenosylhomocysteine nucleosidase [Clostridia bacterium]
MRIGILCAGDREVAPFLPIIDHCRITEKAMLKFYEGQINGVEIVTLFSGVCKVNAAVAAQILIDTFGVQAIINAGTAGGMKADLEIFDTAISTEVAYHDVAPNILTEFHPWLETVYFKADPQLLALSRQAVAHLALENKVYWGTMVTGEAFITEESRQAINERFAPLTVDMESASIAHVCHVNSIPFLSIRSVTDNAAHSGSAHFEENCAKASTIARDITVALLAELRNHQSGQ